MSARYQRADFASDPDRSRGRDHPIPESATRTPFQRDRDRIIHASAFRRLKQKTQVFVAHEGDHHRTRLTHSLEVAQIARSLARALRLDEDLAEALALAHDLGHPPFGHAGEAALHAAMREFGGFDHNAQALRIVTAIEQRYPGHDGLNLTWETLEGVVKHNGPVLDGRTDEAELPWALTEYRRWRDLELGSYASLEAQVAAIADDIAYNNHDIDDGLRARLFSIEDVMDVPFVGVIDLMARLEGVQTVIDFKTASTSYQEHEVRLSDQLSAYQLAQPQAPQLALCVLVKTKEPRIEWYTARRESQQLQEFLAKAEIVGRHVEENLFYKRPGKWCAWCEYLPICQA